VVGEARRDGSMEVAHNDVPGRGCS
jgi:hypothetical protein